MGAFSASGNHNIPKLVFLTQTQLFFALLLECVQNPKWQHLLQPVAFCWAGGSSFPQPSGPWDASPEPLEAGRAWCSCPWLSWGTPAAAHSCRGNCTAGDHILGELLCLAMNLSVEAAVTNPADPHLCWVGWLTKRGQCSVFRALL